MLSAALAERNIDAWGFCRAGWEISSRQRVNGGVKKTTMVASEICALIADALDGVTFAVGDVRRAMMRDDAFACEVVGNIMQEWLQGWLDKNGIDYALNPNTQMPPDFYLSPEDRKRNLLEVKAFNYKASPGFDIADFRMYAEEIIREPYMLDVDYLIFGYEMGDDGVVTIRKVWLKKVWEITRRMAKWPLNLQVKKKVVNKIRPGVWYAKKPRDFHTFSCLEDFVSAVEETCYRNPATRETLAPEWKPDFLAAYERFYGKPLQIPHWNEIEKKYCVPKLAKMRGKKS